MSYYVIRDTIDAGHHSFEVLNEEGEVFARGEGSSFLAGLDNLRRAIVPTRRGGDDYWLSPLDETEEDYR